MKNIQIQIISATAHQCSPNVNNSRKRCHPMHKTRRKYHKKIFEWIKQSKLYFQLKVATNNIKIKIYYRSCRRWMHSGRNITYECCVSESPLYEVLNAVPDDVFKRKFLFNG